MTVNKNNNNNDSPLHKNEAFYDNHLGNSLDNRYVCNLIYDGKSYQERKRVDDLDKVKPNTAKKRRQRANISKDKA